MIGKLLENGQTTVDRRIWCLEVECDVSFMKRKLNDCGDGVPF